jgi:integrase
MPPSRSRRGTRPWNRSKLLEQKPQLKPKEVWAIRIRLQLQKRLRDLALFNLAIDSKFRGCDLVALRVDDVLLGSRVRPQALVLQKKTGRPVQFEITEQTPEAVMQWIRHANLKPDNRLFPGRPGPEKPLRGTTRALWMAGSTLSASIRRSTARTSLGAARTVRSCASLLGRWGLEPGLVGRDRSRRLRRA